MSKSPDAFRTISEVSEWLDTPTYVLRFWESRFAQIKPVKRAGGRRYYRPEDMMLLGGIKKLLHFDELTIKSVKQMLKDKGVKHVMDLSPDINTPVISPSTQADEAEKADIAALVDETPRVEKPKVEVRVVKKGKIVSAEDDAVANKDAVSDDIAPAGELDESAVKDDASEQKADAAQKDDVPESVAEALTMKKKNEKNASVGDKGIEADGGDNAQDVADPVVVDPVLIIEETTDPAKKDTPEPDLLDAVSDAMDKTEESVSSASESVSEEVSLDAMAKAKADEDMRIAAAKKAAAEKTRMDEEAAGWDEMSADMIRNAPFALRPAGAYDADTLSEIETLYYSLRIARNSMRRSIAKQQNRAG